MEKLKAEAERLGKSSFAFAFYTIHKRAEHIRRLEVAVGAAAPVQRLQRAEELLADGAAAARLAKELLALEPRVDEPL